MSLLVGDIGGTHSRFGLVDGAGQRPAAVEIEDNDGHPEFGEAVARYLERQSARPRRAVFAIAGPVGTNGRGRLTNRDWEIDADALERRFGFADVRLVNDFVAQAAALPHLAADETVAIGEALPRGDRSKAALGPGTGLGVAALIRTDAGWLPAATEGGHVELAAVTRRESEAFEAVRRAHGRVSAESVLSGPGLARLHAALGEIDGLADDPLDAAAITARAEAGESRAKATVALFLTLLARFAGDAALAYGAWGGVYLCGGVTPRLGSLIDHGAFRAAFEAKNPHEALLRATATLIVTSPVAGLIGCAALDDPEE